MNNGLLAGTLNDNLGEIIAKLNELMNCDIFLWTLKPVNVKINI